ncbi:MAG: Asp23/Gls24 family envelope stress response protein [Polyangia bacterium]
MAQQTDKKVLVEEKNPSGIPGSLTLNEEVVATIAGLAAKEVGGIHSVGKTPLISFGDDPTRGVGTEVGKKQAAFDLDIVVEYGHDIREIAKELREKTASEVARMAGRDVVEINVHVVDIKLPNELESKKSRVI